MPDNSRFSRFAGNKLKDAGFFAFLMVLGFLTYGWVIWPELGFYAGAISTVALIVIALAAFIQHVSRRVKLLLAWAFLVGAPLAMLAAATLPQTVLDLPHYEQAKDEHHEKQDEAKPREPFWKRATDDPVAFFTLWLVGFTGLLAVATIRLWASTDSIVTGAESTAKRQLRAYVGLTNGYVTPSTERDKVNIHIVFENAGQTPARHVNTWADIRIDHTEDGPFDFPFPTSPHRDAGGVVVPRGTMSLDMIESINADSFNAIVERKCWIRVWGIVCYLDVFGDQHHFIFRHSINGPLLANRWGLSVDVAGHEAT